MHERHDQTPRRTDGATYEIRLTGDLGAHWTAWFDGWTVASGVDGTTAISGQVADQSALHGLLQRVRDLGLPLISVRRIEADEPAATTLPGAIAPDTRKGH